jgi:hypothetical protein
MTEPVVHRTEPLRAERELQIEFSPDKVEWAQFSAGMRRLRTIAERESLKGDIPMPYLVVTAAGLSERVRLRDHLLLHNVHVLRRFPVPNWPRAQTILTLRRFGEIDLLHAYAQEELWRLLHPGSKGDCWFLWSPQRCRQLATDPRRLLPPQSARRMRVKMGDLTFPLELPPFHAPPAGEVALEFPRLRWLIDNS